MTDSFHPTAPSGESAKRNPWVRWVVLGCFGMILLGGLFFVGIGAVVLKSLKSSGAYQMALTAVQASPGAKAVLGEPIEGGWWVTGSISVSGPSGDAAIAFPVSGPDGEATVYAEGLKTAGKWDLHLLDLEIEENAERIDILSEREGRSLDIIQSFLSLVVQGDYEAAHNHFARPLKDVQPYDTFEAAARNNANLFQARELNLEKSAGEGGPTYQGTLTLETGDEISASFHLVREAGSWRLMAYNLGS